jgi:ComF family protein
MVHVFKNIINLLLPSRCVLCGQPSAAICICEPCKNDLPRTAPQCYQCGLPLPAGHGKTCGQCLRNPPFFDHTVSPLQYTFPTDQLVRALKFHRQLAEGRVLSHLMCEHITTGGHTLPDHLIPVPLHQLRMIKRGFNQAFELGRYAGSMLGIPMQINSLRRKRNTRAQSGLSRKQRHSNVLGAFYWRGHNKPGRHVALIDDVMTTGTTVSECARVLKIAGAERVDVWVPARAIPGQDTGPDRQARPSAHGHTTHR